MGWTLVTGATSGLGREICLLLAKLGFPLLVHYYQNKSSALELADLCKKERIDVQIKQGDFSTPESVDRFASGLEDVSHLINNAGCFLIEAGSKTSVDQWRYLYQINFFSPLALVQGLLPGLKRFKGCVVNIGSVGVGFPRADIKYTAYTATKMSLHYFTRSLAKELAPDGVRVNMVSPGEMENSSSLEENFQKLPMGRPATLKETAAIVGFLMKPENAYLTGQNIEVGGGFAL